MNSLPALGTWRCSDTWSCNDSWVTNNWSVFFLYPRSCLNLRKRWWCHRGRAPLRPKTYINIKVFFSWFQWLTFFKKTDLLSIICVKVMTSPPLILQHWWSTPLHQFKWDDGTFPCLTRTQPHKSSSGSLTYLTSDIAAVLPAIFTLLLLLQYRMNTCVLPFILFCITLCCFAFMCLLLYYFVFKKWREKQKQNASIIFEKHCDEITGIRRQLVS